MPHIDALPDFLEMEARLNALKNVHPPFNQTWSESEKLRWCKAKKDIMILSYAYYEKLCANDKIDEALNLFIDALNQNYLNFIDQLTERLEETVIVQNNDSFSQNGLQSFKIFLEQVLGISKNENALVYLKHAAQQDLIVAQIILGHCYTHGLGVEKNPQEALRLYSLAAEKGSSLAQYILGSCYSTGDGIEKNLQEAIRFYRLAAAQGNSSAQNNLGACYYQGKGVEKNLQEAFKLLRMAVAQGNNSAHTNLGYYYSHGNGAEKNLQEASRLYHLAAEGGSRAAKDNLINIHQSAWAKIHLALFSENKELLCELLKDNPDALFSELYWDIERTTGHSFFRKINDVKTLLIDFEPLLQGDKAKPLQIFNIKLIKLLHKAIHSSDEDVDISFLDFWGELISKVRLVDLQEHDACTLLQMVIDSWYLLNIIDYPFPSNYFSRDKLLIFSEALLGRLNNLGYQGEDARYFALHSTSFYAKAYFGEQYEISLIEDFTIEHAIAVLQLGKLGTPVQTVNNMFENPVFKISEPDLGNELKDQEIKQETKLINAVKKQQTNRVKDLLGAPDADINCADYWGKNSLMYAFSHKNKEIAQLLLDAGADPSVVGTPDGKTFYPEWEEGKKLLETHYILSRAKDKFDQLIADLKKKAENLTGVNQIIKAKNKEIVCEQAQKLENMAGEFFAKNRSQQNKTYKTFKKNCIDILSATKNNLNEFTWKQLFSDLVQTVTLIGSVIGVIQYAKTGRYSLFSVETDTKKTLNSLGKWVDEVNHTNQINTQVIAPGHAVK